MWQVKCKVFMTKDKCIINKNDSFHVLSLFKKLV